MVEKERWKKGVPMMLVLASASPRRREILETLGVSFEVFVTDADESSDLSDPGARVGSIAARKCKATVEALEAAERLTADTVVLAADTLVVLDGDFLGKPQDDTDARAMVTRLQGRTHAVVSGICLYKDGRMVTAHEITEVTFAPMTASEVDAYVATGESHGKAGAYAIQGYASRFIEGIRGDYFNVVGLPVRRLYATLAEAFGIQL